MLIPNVPLSLAQDVAQDVVQDLAQEAAQHAVQARPAAPAVVSQFALVIGENRTESAELLPLRYADDDAVAMHSLLRESGVDAVLLTQTDRETSELHPHLGVGAASLGSVAQARDALASRVRAAQESGAETELIFYFSGHGEVEAGEGYLVLADGHLSRSGLADLLRTVGAQRNHVFIDACQSYSLVFGRGAGGKRRPYRGAAPALTSAMPNTGFVLSTASARVSHEWARYEGGIFSHEVRSGLRGGADANVDGSVSYAELGAFIATANRELLPRYRPQVLILPPYDDMRAPLVSWRSVAAVSFEAGAWGHVYVENSAGQRLMDVHLAQAQTALLHLPDERPLFVRKADESMELTIGADTTEISVAEARVPRHRTKGAASLAFERLFARPFSVQQVSQFEQAPPTEAALVPEQPPTPSAAASPHDHTQHARSQPLRTSAWVVGGAAVVSALVGIAAGGYSYAQQRTSNQDCMGDICATQAGVDAMDRALTAGRVADVALIGAGALAIGSGVLFWLVRSRESASSERARTRIDAGLTSIQLTRTFE